MPTILNHIGFEQFHAQSCTSSHASKIIKLSEEGDVANKEPVS